MRDTWLIEGCTLLEDDEDDNIILNSGDGK